MTDAFIYNSAVWFIDPFRTVLYELPFGPDGQLPEKPKTLQISGGGFNAADVPNGITQTPDAALFLSAR